MLEVVFDDDAIPQLLDRLTLEEKCSLLSGSDFWHTEPIERLDIPALMLTDGPHGVRFRRRHPSLPHTVHGLASVGFNCPEGSWRELSFFHDKKQDHTTFRAQL